MAGVNRIPGSFRVRQTRREGNLILLHRHTIDVTGGLARLLVLAFLLAGLGAAAWADRAWFPITRLSGTSADGVLQLANPDSAPRTVSVWFCFPDQWLETTPVSLTLAPRTILERDLTSLRQGLPVTPSGQTGFLVVDDPAGARALLVLPECPAEFEADKGGTGSPDLVLDDPKAGKGQPGSRSGPYPVYSAAPSSQAWAVYQRAGAGTTTALLLANPSAQPVTLALSVSDAGGQTLASGSLALPAYAVQAVPVADALFSSGILPDSGIVRLDGGAAFLCRVFDHDGEAFLPVAEIPAAAGASGHFVPEFSRFLRFGDGDRLLLANPGPQPLAVVVRLYNGGGWAMGSRDITLAGGEFQVRSATGLFSGHGWWGFDTYAVIEAPAGSPLLWSAVISGGKKAGRMVPGVLSAVAPSGEWLFAKTRLFQNVRLYNPHDHAVTATLSQYTSEGVLWRSESFTLRRGSGGSNGSAGRGTVSGTGSTTCPAWSGCSRPSRSTPGPGWATPAWPAPCPAGGCRPAGRTARTGRPSQR